VLAVDGTNLVADAKRRHSTAPTATAALGRTLMGALLMASFRKDDEAVQVSFKGDGVLGGVFAIADTRGHVKGKVGNSNADPPLRPDGKLAVGDAVGEGEGAVLGDSEILKSEGILGTLKLLRARAYVVALLHAAVIDASLSRNIMSRGSLTGEPPPTVAPAPAAGVLSVVRSHPLQPQPYTGMVKIVSGEIAEDLATYMVRCTPSGRRTAGAQQQTAVVKRENITCAWIWATILRRNPTQATTQHWKLRSSCLAAT
jgi:hypothetical protein